MSNLPTGDQTIGSVMSFQVAAVPEPGAIAFLGFALLLLVRPKPF